jgi:hypothetical protein
MQNIDAAKDRRCLLGLLGPSSVAQAGVVGSGRCTSLLYEITKQRG